MRVLIGVLLAIAVAVLPMQSRTMSVCACGSENGPGAGGAIEVSADAPGLAPGGSCCSTGSRGGEPDGDRPGGLPCQNDDCPRSCCSTAKVTAATERLVSARFSVGLVAMVVQESASSPATAHVLGLVRPPRPSRSV